jgi:hypothetical protein
MSDKPNRRILDRPTGVLSLLASGSRVTGDIETPGALMIGCHVRGDGNIGGELQISAEAHWEGDVHALSAVVAGHVTGSIVVRRKIEIAASAVIRGRHNRRRDHHHRRSAADRVRGKTRLWRRGEHSVVSQPIRRHRRRQPPVDFSMKWAKTPTQKTLVEG